MKANLSHRILLFARYAAGICIVLFTGCNVGPKYVKPAAPTAPAYKEAAPAAYSAAPPGTWQPAQPQDATLKGKWWEMFNEPELNALEDQLNIDNQNIKQFFENFMAARAQVSEARAGYYPTVTANPSLTKTGTGNGVTTGSYSLPVEATWAPDLFGRIRNTVREAQYAAQVSAADLENERLTEQAALAEYFFQLRGQDQLQELNNRIVTAYREELNVTRALVETGIDPPQAIPQAEEALEDAEAASIGIATNRAVYEHAIAMLIGKPASTFSMPVKNLTTPVPAIPVGVPSELLQRRPDIAAAERTMAEANALIGIEKAAYYPTLTLSGSGGFSSGSIASLFSLPALFWSLGASASQIIFDAGLRKATVQQYTAMYNADVASYRQTVLTAFQQVEDYIATLRVVSRQIERENAAINSGQIYVDMETARYQTGLDPYIDVLIAQLTLLSDQETLVTQRVNEMVASVQLIQALGGGWDVTKLPAPSAITSTTKIP
ncbi:MAG: efflux transporter outer membrane subunit [Bryobacteraceae bacterium]